MKTVFLWLWRLSLVVAVVYVYYNVNGDGMGSVVISEPLLTLLAFWYGVLVPCYYYKLVADDRKEANLKRTHQLEVEYAVDVERRKWQEKYGVEIPR